MVDHVSFEVMERLVDDLGSSIGLTAEESHDRAHEVFEFLGAPLQTQRIRPIGGEPTVETDSEDDLASWNGDGLRTTYGVDASMTQERAFTNGVSVCLANARTGVIGPGNHSLADEGRIVVTVADEYDETDLQSQREKVKTDEVTADVEVIHGERPKISGHTMKIKNLARLYAEGRHLRTVVEESESLVFLDGPLYPPLVFGEMMGRYNTDADNAWGGELGGIFMNYVEAVDDGLDEGWPVIGVVKTMDTTGLVEDLRAKVQKFGGGNADIPWQSDIHFLTDLLQTDDPGEYVYTSWFEEERKYVRGGSGGDEGVEPFAGVPGRREPEDYRRAFFYVRNPGTQTVMRIETAKGFVDDLESRDLIQQRVLAELAKVGNVPEAVGKADSEARISRRNQQKLFGRLYGRMRSVTDYNEDYRGPDYTGSGE